MKGFVLAAALFGFSTVTTTQYVQADDRYLSVEIGSNYSDGYPGSYGDGRSLKDAPYSGGKADFGTDLPKRAIGYRGNGYGYNNYCVRPRQIRQNLRHHGWFGFHNRRMRSGVMRINAERGDGCIFRLRVDRCTGAILGKRLVSRPGSGYNRRNNRRNNRDYYGSSYSRNYNIY